MKPHLKYKEYSILNYLNNYYQLIIKVYYSIIDIYYKNSNLDFDDYCRYLGNESSEYAKELIHDAFKDDTREQALAAIRALNMAEIQLARFLYYFCNYNLKEEKFVEPKLKLYNLSLGVS